MKNLLFKLFITTALLTFSTISFADTVQFYVQTGSYYAIGSPGSNWEFRATQCPLGSAQIGGVDPRLTTSVGVDMYGKPYNLNKCLCNRSQNDCPTGVYSTGNLGFTSYVQCETTVDSGSRVGDSIYAYCAGVYGQARGCDKEVTPTGVMPNAVPNYSPVITTYAVAYPRCG